MYCYSPSSHIYQLKQSHKPSTQSTVTSTPISFYHPAPKKRWSNLLQGVMRGHRVMAVNDNKTVLYDQEVV